MKSKNFSFVKGLNPFVFCFGMFLLAMAFSVVICFSTFYAFHNLNNDANVAKKAPVQETGTVKSIYASVK